MSFAAHIAPDPVEQSRHAIEDMSSSLDSFFSEATIVQTPSNFEEHRHPLWQFPEEGAVASAPTTLPVRSWTTAARYAALGLAVLIAAITGVWWAEVIPGSSVAMPETARSAAMPPATAAPRDRSNVLPPTELTSSIQVWPSARPPIATIVPAALPFSAATEQAHTPDRVTAALASRPAPTVSIATSGTRPVAELPVTTPAAANLPVRLLSPDVEMPASTAPPAVAPLPSSMPATVGRPEPAALPSVVTATEHIEIQRTLAQYRTAYQLLDAQAAQAVWPSVDVRALARAFDSLESQQLAFENCQLEIAGESATAECRGSATYAPKVGNRGPKLEPRQWTFRLQKEREGWKIQSAQTRR